MSIADLYLRARAKLRDTDLWLSPAGPDTGVLPTLHDSGTVHSTSTFTAAESIVDQGTLTSISAFDFSAVVVDTPVEPEPTPQPLSRPGGSIFDGLPDLVLHEAEVKGVVGGEKQISASVDGLVGGRREIVTLVKGVVGGISRASTFEVGYVGGTRIVVAELDFTVAGAREVSALVEGVTSRESHHNRLLRDDEELLLLLD